MSFDALLGNDRLKENLNNSLRTGRISHFYLITGPEGSGKHTLARLLAAAILCKEPNRPCGACPACRKVLSGSHPDVITVDDPEKKTVSVELVRKARSDIYIRPNEADYKIYLFPRGQDMRTEAQNALLKVLEEPPAYGVFLLLADSPERLLPTIRSRCTALSLTALPEGILTQALAREFPAASQADLLAAASRSGGFFGQARALLAQGAAYLPQTEDFARAMAQRDALLLTQTLVPMEKWKRDQLIPALQQWEQLLSEALACRAGLPIPNPLARDLADARQPGQLMQARTAIHNAIEYAQQNVSPAAICGHLVWALR